MHLHSHSSASTDRTPLLLLSFQATFSKLLVQHLIKTKLYEVLASTNDCHEAIRLAKELHSALLVADLALDEANVLNALQSVQRHDGQIRIVAFNVPLAAISVQHAVLAGALGCLTIDAQIGELTQALAAVHSGRTFFSPSVTRLIGSQIQNPAPATSKVDSVGGLTTEQILQELTTREKEVLAYAVARFRDKDIAEELGTSLATVRTHMHHLLSKLGTPSRRKLALIIPDARTIPF